MKLVKGLSEYIMPLLSSLDKVEFNRRAKSESKALQHGGMLSGDTNIDSRTVSVEVMLDTSTAAEYQAQTDELKRYSYRKDQRLYITDMRYINVACLSKYQESYFNGFYMVKGTVDLTFLALDPFFYDDAMTVVEEIITASPHTFTVNNPGNIDTPTVITITANASTTTISFKNTSDNDRRFDYNDVQMVDGQVLIVDAINGTVQRGTDNTINNFGGTFLNLLPGDNLLEYTGGNCTIEVSYPVRWL